MGCAEKLFELRRAQVQLDSFHGKVELLTVRAHPETVIEHDTRRINDGLQMQASRCGEPLCGMGDSTGTLASSLGTVLSAWIAYFNPLPTVLSGAQV